MRRAEIEYLEGDEIRPSNQLKATVERYARQVAEVAGFQIGQSPADIAKMFGGKINFRNLDEWVDESGSIFVHGPGEFDIILPYYTSPRRDCFTVAHELGHYFLHSRQGEIPIVAFRKGSTRIEWEANWFAASLLMPEEEFRSELQSHSLAAVAAKFGVSEDAAKVRSESLGIR